MKQPETGTQNDLIEHRFRVAKEDLDTAYLLLDAKQYRGANNRAYYSIYHTTGRNSRTTFKIGREIL